MLNRLPFNDIQGGLTWGEKKEHDEINCGKGSSRFAVIDKFQKELIYWDENVLEWMFDPKRMCKAIITLNA